jgi:hypothetical protein
MRWGIGRMRYRVEPGLYAVGRPGPQSPVLASANYKLSFDRLRRELGGLDAWVLVLDTKGVNVWCSAGKGTFGTDELIERVESCRLAEVVAHRTLIVPQLGASGVAAHEVRKRSGFRVVYGPVRAADIPPFLAAGMKATAEMRRVRFPLRDRLAVVPVDLVLSAKYALAIAVGMLLLAGLGVDGYDLARIAGVGIPSAVCFLLAYVASTVLTPALLPWLPGRALAAKGAWMGALFLLAVAGWQLATGGPLHGWMVAAAWGLLIPATASFMAMTFTGATTYTSLSGVRREVRLAAPWQAAAGALGGVLWIVGRFVGDNQRRSEHDGRFAILGGGRRSRTRQREMHGLRDVPSRLSARGLHHRRREGLDRGSRRLHGMRRLRQELPRRSHRGAGGGWLRGSGHPRRASRHAAWLRLHGQCKLLRLKRIGESRFCDRIALAKSWAFG